MCKSYEIVLCTISRRCYSFHPLLKGHKLRLKTKIIGILLIVLLLYAGFSFSIQWLAVFPNFLALERVLAERDLNRCIAALRREALHLDLVTHDWAAWDDTYSFIERRQPEFIESNLGPKTFFDNQFNLIYLCTPDGKKVWGEAWDLNTQQRISLPEFPSDGLGEGHILASNYDVELAISGIVMTSKGPMLLASRPVVTSNHAGPIRGYLVMGRFLNEAYVKTLAEQINVEHTYMPITFQDDPEWSTECAHQTSLCHESSSRFDDHDQRVIRVENTFSDIYGNPALKIQASIPREVYAKGVVTIRFAMVLICISGILALICLWLLMNSNILNPIADLTRQIIKIRGPDNRHLQRSFPRRSDEIGDLYCEFENMLTDQNYFHDGLVEANLRLSSEIEKSQQSESLRISHENKLRKLAAELLFTEERERRRLAGDLHDRIGQALALCQIQLGLLTQMNQNSYLDDKIKEVHDGIEQIIQDTRTLTFEVSPPVLYELGLEAAIEWFAEETEKQHHIKVRIVSAVSETLNNETINVFAFRALRELILNVVKHANARSIEITIRNLANRLYLQVVDDGVGFDTTALWPHGATDCGFGLFSIQERAESLGGQFSIKSTPEMGTHAELILPTKLEAACL